METSSKRYRDVCCYVESMEETEGGQDAEEGQDGEEKQGEHQGVENGEKQGLRRGNFVCGKLWERPSSRDGTGRSCGSLVESGLLRLHTKERNLLIVWQMSAAPVYELFIVPEALDGDRSSETEEEGERVRPVHGENGDMEEEMMFGVLIHERVCIRNSAADGHSTH